MVINFIVLLSFSSHIAHITAVIYKLVSFSV